MIAVGLAIAAVPEGLAAVVTISLALGMREMVRRHALIRKLPAVETLGSVTVICSDKTGTLTENRMTVTILDFADNQLDLTEEEQKNIQSSISEIHYVEEPTEQQTTLLRQHPSLVLLLSGGAMCNDALIEADKESPNRVVMIGDPTEGALVVAAARMGLPKALLEKSFPRVAEVPFESERKRMTTIHRFPQTIEEVEPPLRPIWDWENNLGTTHYVAFTKGSVDGLLSITKQIWADDRAEPLDDHWRKRIEKANATLAEQGVRVLGVATRTLDDLPEEVEAKDVEKDLIFVGLVGMIDPARPEVKDAVNTCRKAGIRPIMITGDHPLTARYIASELGIADQGEVVNGAQLEKMEDAELLEVVKRVSVFARVSPEHKLRIVSALQNNGHVAAMTGDGVNDAPALKKADIGVAMGITGTDVAKGTADMVLTDDNYASIVAAIEQGRVIYSNIRKFVFFLLSSNLAEVMIIFLATLAGLPMPLTVIQLLWLNLLTDGAPALALAMEKGDPDVMDRPPRPRNESIINSSMRLGMIIQTIAQSAVVLCAFMLGLFWHLDTQMPAGENPFLYMLRHNWSGVDVQTAETMAFVTLSLCELFRAFTVRSERASLFQIGAFSNKYMLYAVGLSAGLLLLVVNLPFLQPIFNTI
jgi:Ca2+-transporting ATPase